MTVIDKGDGIKVASTGPVVDPAVELDPQTRVIVNLLEIQISEQKKIATRLGWLVFFGLLSIAGAILTFFNALMSYR
jgi:hypothetical protein